MNNRQGNGRRRGRNNGNNNQRPQGNGRGGDSGNRIDSRARGNAAQLLEKYRNMARDAQLSGDRVMTEYYLQFADHYFRVLSDARNRQEEQRARFDGDGEEGASQQSPSDDEAEDVDELDAIDMIGRAPRNRGNANGGNQNREFNRDRDANRDERPRDGQREGNRDFNRDRPREDRPRDERQREDRPRDDRPRDDRPRQDRPRDDRPREDRPMRSEERGLRPRRERPARVERDHDDAPAMLDLAVLPPAIGLDIPPRDDMPTASNDAEAAPPKKRGRPRKVTGEGEGEAA